MPPYPDRHWLNWPRRLLGFVSGEGFFSLRAMALPRTRTFSSINLHHRGARVVSPFDPGSDREPELLTGLPTLPIEDVLL